MAEPGSGRRSTTEDENDRWWPLVIGVLLALIVFGPQYILRFDGIRPGDPYYLGQLNVARELVSKMATGVAAAFGLYLALLKAKQAFRQNEIAQAGQLAERFLRAVEAMEDTTGSVARRLAGIHALDCVALESTEGPYRRKVATLLAAYVRQRTQPTAGDFGERDWSSDASFRPEVQEALLTLSRAHLERQGIDLSCCDLRAYDLSALDLSGADLSGSWFPGDQQPGMRDRDGALD